MAYFHKKLITKIVLSTVVSLFMLFTAFLGFDCLYPINLKRYHDQSTAILDCDGQPLRFFLSQDDKWRLPTTTTDVHPLYLAMLKNYEDKRFDQHFGVDPLAITRALFNNIQQNRITSGASTLTMQTVRLLEPRPRTLPNKIIEMIRALQLELHHSKDEILAIYLTLAPYGGNIEGVKAASWFYFHKDPRFLTPAEAALLVAIPQSPKQFSPLTNPVMAYQGRQKVLEKAFDSHLISNQEWAEAAKTTLPLIKHAVPFHAPHLAEKLRRDHPGERQIQTTINKDLQTIVEKICRDQLPKLDPKATMAAIIVDHQSLEVLAYVGSADYFDTNRDGQVNMITAIRSPGSTLKPFIYALAFDEKLIHPLTFAQDAPTYFGDYAPSNFSDRFYGQVTIREALQASLNVPAVAVLDLLGANRFAYHLRSHGIDLQIPSTQAGYGLPIALGGVGLRFEDLIRLYVALARDGSIHPLKVTSGETTEASVAAAPLIGDLGRIMVRDILAQTPTPDHIVPLSFKGFANSIAYKTGTSYGFRDAWAIGYNNRYVVGVWIGRPDGTPHIDQYGYKTAAPLMFQLFDLLPRDQSLTTAQKISDPLLSIHQNADLPPGLQVLTSPSTKPKDIRFITSANKDVPVKPLRIIFPVHNTHLALNQDDQGQIKSIPISLEGGAAPYYCFVNGVPIGYASYQHTIPWSPIGAGFYDITIVDNQNNSAQVKIFIEP